MLDLVNGTEPFVAFVGAGASAPPPSNVPRWKEFNDLLLECLCERIAEFTRNRFPAETILEPFRKRRDETNFFAPDFQAQLMEEEVGADYFRVWQSIDTDACGPVHEALAELAARGRLSAVVTTNFDRLIERAFQARGVAHRVVHDQRGFEKLEGELDLAPPGSIPVIKIHGSIEDSESLVDTLKQRLAGRPAPLMKSLQILLRRHAWLYLGFSGADFSYDGRYLGVLDAASEAKGFVFLNPEGRTVEPGVLALAEAYGSTKASVIGHGDLARWLARSFGLALSSASAADAGDRDAAMGTVKREIGRWVQGLGPIAVVNILFSMLRTVGMESDAYWLLRRTWRKYREPEHLNGKSYVRYNYNHGLALLEAGLISNPVPLATDGSNAMEWREHADENAYEYLARAYQLGHFLPAGGALIGLLAYRGDIAKAAAIGDKVWDEVKAGAGPLEWCDLAIGGAPLFDVLQSFSRPIVEFRRCLEIASSLGDEPRRATLCMLLGRFLTYAGRFEEADSAIGQAERIAERLGLRSVLVASLATRGLWLADSGKSSESAVLLLKQVVEMIKEQDEAPLVTKVDLADASAEPRVVRARRPLLCRVLLDLNRASMLAGDQQAMEQTLDELDELAVEVFLGYCPHYYLAYAQCLLLHGAGNGERKQAAELVARAREVGRLTQNPWASQQADHLDLAMKQ